MSRSLTLTALLITVFVIAACSGGNPQDSEERATSSEPQQTQLESSPESASEETARKQLAQERDPAEDEAVESAKDDARGSEESSGLSVTTIEGEEARVGEQGTVTALFFMAGW